MPLEALDDSTRGAPTGAKGSSMEGNKAPQPGWWRASDGLWYPPETLPAGWFIDVDGVAKQGQPVAPPLPMTSSVPPRSEPLPLRTPTYTAPGDPSPSLPSRAWHRYTG